ncbi:MAG TPA: PilC/PilY family type IV pilus protein [Acidobacteriota bacterium]|nr:PilC/PilY family type IV pilus protein [Acidobacteriota bacterium]HQM61851.1 PilC/PilY family type IV pilus protein [Acidobacteriota bacterium]
MNTRWLWFLIILVLSGLAAVAQTGQNQPVYDPNDPIGRLLPPNIHFVIDVSGSMSCQPNGASGGQCSNYDFAGQRTDSKIYITKTAINSLMSRDNLRLRWSFWMYTNSDSYALGHDINRYYSRGRWYSNYAYFPTNLYTVTERRDGTRTRTYDTYFFIGSGCSGSRDRLLVPLPHGSDNDPFMSSVDPGYDNRGAIKSWVDRNFDRTTGTLTVPGLTWKFATELPARGSTPISYSLQSIARYLFNRNLDNSTKACYYFDLASGTHKNWSPYESQTGLTPLPDQYFDCRYNAIMLLTDGRDTCAGVDAAVDAADTLRSRHKVDTFVVGFGLQSESDKAGLDSIAQAGGTNYAYFADNEGDLLNSLEKILGSLGSEISGDTEPILGFIEPTAITFPKAMPEKVLLQNVMFKASMTYSPVFKGHMRAFQALTTSTVEGKIDFLTDFTKNSDNKLWDFADWIDTTPHTDRVMLFLDGDDMTEFTKTNGNDIASTAGLGSLSKDELELFITWVRTLPLGSITYSTPAFVGPPSLTAYGSAEYLNWAKSLQDRIPMLLFGSNDGQLHCVDVETGAELWSFIIPAAIEGTSSRPARIYTELYASGDVNSQGQPDVYGTRIYNRRPHFYYMASSPKVIDARDSSGDWHTLCVFGIGAGGREYYCLDITNPDSPEFMWRFSGTTANPLGETWSVPALGRFGPATADYPNGMFGAVVGSGFNLNPSFPEPAKLGKSVFILNLTDPTNGVPSIIYSYHMADTSTTAFGASPTALVSRVGNCFFAPPVAFVSPRDRDPYVDEVYIGDYDGNLYQFVLDKADITNTTARLMFQAKNGTPIYSVPFVATINLPGIGYKTLITFNEYGKPIDSSFGARSAGVMYCLVKENLPTSGVIPVSDLIASTGATTTFNPSTSKGFYFEFPGAAEGESSPFRPTIFFTKDRAWIATTSYKFFVGGTSCDPINHTVGAGTSSAYIFNALNGGYFNSTPVELSSGGSWYGRASAFHKGARGEGWIDIGTGETWGWGYSQSHDKFEKFDAAAGNITYDMNPTAGVEVRMNYWREFK